MVSTRRVKISPYARPGCRTRSGWWVAALQLCGSSHAEGTTQSAVADGAITIRDQANQQQDLANLSRDTEHANDSISPIFDKEKEQNRLQTAQLIGEIGGQVADIVRTNGEIAKEKAKKDPQALKAAKETLVGLGKLNPTAKEISDQAGKTAEAQYGTGSALQRGISAATAAVQALAGGDIKSALAGAAAPEIAYLIGQNVKDDTAKVIAHAVVNAALAAATGKDAAAAAASAATGEIVGKLALDVYNKQVGDLSEEQKQNVSALATLAAGLAGGLVGDSSATAIAGAQTGKTTVENNLMGGTEAGQTTFVQEHGKDILSCATDAGGAACQRGQAVNKAIALALGGGAAGAAAIAVTPALVASAQAAATACAANPVLCANQVSIWAAEAGMADALPAGLGVAATGKIGEKAVDKLAELSALMSVEKQTGQKVSKETVSNILASTTERNSLPAGYAEGGSVGAKFNTSGGLPEGYRRVVNTKTGNTEVLGADGKLYLETDAGLVPKQGGNLDQVAEAAEATAANAGKNAGKETAQVKNLGDVSEFLSSQSANINKKLGTKIGQGRLPYEAGKAGVEQAKAAIKETLENATQISPIIPSSSVRGGYDLIHVYSAKTNSTVSLKVLPDGKYEFDTLIPEKSSKF